MMRMNMTTMIVGGLILFMIFRKKDWGKMPHKLVVNKTNYRVRSYVTGKLLKKKYPKTKKGRAQAMAKINSSYNRSKRVRHTRRKKKSMFGYWKRKNAGVNKWT